MFVILQEFNAKLSDFGLAKAGPTGDNTHVTTKVMGTQGYAAPEYIATGLFCRFTLPIIYPKLSLFQKNICFTIFTHIKFSYTCIILYVTIFHNF